MRFEFICSKFKSSFFKNSFTFCTFELFIVLPLMPLYFPLYSFIFLIDRYSLSNSSNFASFFGIENSTSLFGKILLFQQLFNIDCS